MSIKLLQFKIKKLVTEKNVKQPPRGVLSKILLRTPLGGSFWIRFMERISVIVQLLPSLISSIPDL